MLSKEQSIREGMHCINQNGRGIVLLVDEDQRLIGTVTDGDIRSAVLDGINLDIPLSDLLLRRKGSGRDIRPITAAVDASSAELIALMKRHHVSQIPLVDVEQRVVNLVTIEDVLPSPEVSMDALVMAGGFGTRLLPLTESTPKPMLMVGESPLLEHIVKQLRQSGVQRVHIATHYLSEKILDHFGSGEQFGVEVSYLNENEPLGTAGALGLMPEPKHPLLVVNGDILTGVDFRSLLKFHQKNQASVTIAVRRYELKVPYGVVHSDGPVVSSLEEKPQMEFIINAGIYLIEPSVCSHIRQGERLDMPELINRVIAEAQTVVAFPIWEHWLDIGDHGDYERAQEQILDSGR